MRYVFVFLFALVFSCGFAPFAEGQTAPKLEGPREHTSLDSELTTVSSQETQGELISVMEEQTPAPPKNAEHQPAGNHVVAQPTQVTRFVRNQPTSDQMCALPTLLNWFATNNADHACGGQLVISNVPFGVWLEIGGSFYRHKDTSGMKHVIVDGIAGFENPKFVRTGRSSYAIRSTNAKSATVQLLADQAVYLDWTREFISLDHQVDKANGVFSLASMTAVARPVSSEPVATVPARVVQAADEELEIVSSIEAGEFLSLEVARLPVGGVNAISIPTANADASIRLLRISGELERLKALTEKCFLKGPVEMKFTNAAGQKNTLELPSFQLELKLGIGSVEAGKESLVANLLASRFVEAINKEEKIVSLIRDLAPINGEKAVVVLCFGGQKQIGFNNQILGNDVSFETRNSIAEDITIEVGVKFTAPAP